MMAMRLRLCAPVLLGLLLSCDGTQPLVYQGSVGQPVPMQLLYDVPASSAAFSDGDAQLMLLDTGSPLTLLSQHAFPNLSIGPVVGTLEALALKFPSFPTRVVDLFAEDPQCTDPVPTGLIGEDVLGHFALGLDYQGGRAWLFDGADPDVILSEDTGPAEDAVLYLLGGGTVHFGDQTQGIGPTRPIVNVQIEGSNYNAFIDTGSSRTLISQDLFSRLAPSSRTLACCERVSIAFQGTAEVQLTRLATMQVAASEMQGVPVAVLPDDELFNALSNETGRKIDVVIGGSFLRLFASYIDTSAGIWRMYPYNSRSQVGAQEFVLPGFTFCKARDSADGAVVVNVFEGTDAAQQRITPGERMIAIAGQDISALSESEMLALLRQTPVGTTVSLSFAEASGTVQREILVEDILPAQP